MTVKELKDILSKYDENLDVLIDKSVDGGFGCIRDFEDYDIQKYGDTKIIIGYDS